MHQIDVSAACSTPKAPAAAHALMRYAALHMLDVARPAMSGSDARALRDVPALLMATRTGGMYAGVLQRRREQRGGRQQHQQHGHGRGRTGTRKLEAVETRSGRSSYG